MSVRDPALPEKKEETLKKEEKRGACPCAALPGVRPDRQAKLGLSVAWHGMAQTRSDSAVDTLRKIDKPSPAQPSLAFTRLATRRALICPNREILPCFLILTRSPAPPGAFVLPFFFSFFFSLVQPQLLGDTYTTSASFLLRLLVDDRHVCLVAQAKPLPTPELPLPQAQAQAQAAPSVSASVSVSPGSESTLSDSLFSRHADTELTSPSVAPAPAPAPAHELEPDSPGCIYHLPGPAVDLPPPAVTRTLGPPPPKGASRSPDTILGVISAHVAPVRPPTEILLDDHPSPASPPKQVDAHILTVAVAPAERGQGLGARLLDSLLAALPPRVTRTYLEVHPSNHSALALYNSRGFARVPGDAGTKRSFYRGDPRIPLSERLKPNGTDAWVLERFSQ